ncbi:C1 family peptidase [Legionella lytica]|uniref:C1 family peptidase n=1 Tax=Legionella lytica TaxID=96232 RepID=A0ABY4Y6D2_9GAMM|nr:C1 family peptidase [Legionella lytica]USQ13173.1 C1 family peptidase [Legionella lytica]
MQLNKILMLSIALFGNAFATEIEPAGTIDYALKPAGKTQFAKPKMLKLMQFKVSSNAIEAMQQKVQATQKKSFIPSIMPEQKQLGMNGVPVLDQGYFGTCVTFANTAAIDAILGKGDYISQLCLLQLGNYKYSYTASGWAGSLNRSILSRLEDHGFVSKETQRTVGCGDLNEYPGNEDATPTSAISFDSYHKISEGLLDNKIYSAPILDAYKVMLTNEVDTQELISEIKQAINREQRVTMISLLPAIDLGIAGAVGTHHETNDTWVLSTTIERELYQYPFMAGHSMIITGYDDNATAVDDLGRVHMGLFTLRNSWGDQVGDKGDFYMSYDYFKVLGFEANQIVYDEFLSDEDDEDESDNGEVDDDEDDEEVK